MLWSSVKNNLKTILRDPTTALAALVSIIMQFMYGLNVDEFVTSFDIHYAENATRNYNYAMNVMMDIIAKPVFQIAFPFLGVIVAVNIFKEKRSNVYDIIMAEQLSFRQFFLSKLIAYYILGLGMSMVLGLGFEFVYIITNNPFWMGLEWFLILAAQLAWMFALYSSCLLIPIALGVFAASVSGVSVLAPIMNCAYYYLPHMLPSRMYSSTKIYDYLHVVPMKLRIFMKYWPVQLEDWSKVTYGMAATDELGKALYSSFTSTFQDAAASYFAMIALAVVLLTASYFLLKRRYEKM